jgi:hypothetical protein
MEVLRGLFPRIKFLPRQLVHTPEAAEVSSTGCRLMTIRCREVSHESKEGLLTARFLDNDQADSRYWTVN